MTACNRRMYDQYHGPTSSSGSTYSWTSSPISPGAAKISLPSSSNASKVTDSKSVSAAPADRRKLIRERFSVVHQAARNPQTLTGAGNNAAVPLWVKPYACRLEQARRTFCRCSAAAVSCDSTLLPAHAVAGCVGCLPRLQLPAGCGAVSLCVACDQQIDW